VSDSGAPDCPFCASGDVERIGQWGGQMITAQWRCRACSSYFEAIRAEFDDDHAAERFAAPVSSAAERLAARVNPSSERK
jgi:ribosomal protein L37AE/L43A